MDSRTPDGEGVLTRLLCAEDSYMRSFDGQVVDIRGQGVILDQTTFYPRGGGQPCDVGRLTTLGGSWQVLEVYREGGGVIHRLEGSPPPKGTAVRGEIEWDLRYAHMRHHTAVHVLSGVVHHLFRTISTGGQIHRNYARVDFDLEQLTPETVSTIERESLKVVNEARQVTWRVIPREEALKIPDLVRTKPGLEMVQSLEWVRVVEIQGFDIQADGGTHVMNTKEIGPIRIVRTESKGKHNKRIEIALG